MFSLFQKKKIKYSFYGNCQLDSICCQLNESKDFSLMYEYIPVNAVHLLEKDDLKILKKIYSNIDILFYQGVGKNFKNGPEFASDNVLTFLKKDCKKILISSLFFNAYFPDFHEIAIDGYGILLTPLMGSYHDLNILHAYVNNIKSGDFAKIYSGKDYYNKSYCKDLLTRSFTSLEEREADNNVDIKISGFIRDNYNIQKLFNCQNHPKPPVIQYVIDNILLRLGINIKVKARKSDLDFIESPVHPSIYKNLNLRFKNEIEYLTSKGNINDFKTIIELFYEEYRKIDIDILRKGLIGFDCTNKLL